MTHADFSANPAPIQGTFHTFLVPKLYLGTPPVSREISFRADSTWCDRGEIGNGIASASAFPSATWEREALPSRPVLGPVEKVAF
jgi:hypothetical protein